MKLYRESLCSGRAGGREMKVVLRGWGSHSKLLAWAVAVVLGILGPGSLDCCLLFSH